MRHLVPLLLLLLPACRARQPVVWDAVGGSDTLDDVLVAMVLLGRVEGDRELIRGPHAVGTTLSMNVAPKAIGGSAVGWRVESVAPEAVEIVGQTAGDDRLRIDLAFRAPGTSSLYVIDDEGLVVDYQRLDVHAPAALRMATWDDVATEHERLVDEALHLLPGSAVTLVVAYEDVEGVGLSGVGLLGATVDAGPSAGIAATPVTRSGEEPFDSLDVVVADDAVPVETAVALTAAEALVESRPVVVHEPAEVTGLHLRPHVAGRIEAEGEGIVQADLLVGDDRILGAPVLWTVRERGVVREVGEGSYVLFDADPSVQTELEACYGDLCELTLVPGEVTTIGGAVAPLPSSCGCSATGGPLGGLARGWMLLLSAFLVRRRRRPRVAR